MTYRGLAVLLVSLALGSCTNQAAPGADVDVDVTVGDTVFSDGPGLDVPLDGVAIDLGEVQDDVPQDGPGSDVCVPSCSYPSCGNDDGCGGFCLCPPDYWYDGATGIAWQVTPPEGDFNWQQAKDYCAGLSLAGLSGWRLPTISELRSIIRGCPSTMTDGACGVSDSCLTTLCLSPGWETCTPNLGPDEGCYWVTDLTGFCFLFWSSSLVEDYPENAWAVNFDHGEPGYVSVDNVDEGVRCVLDAQ